MLKRTMARLAWATVAFIALAQVVQISVIERALKGFESSGLGRAFIVIVLVIWGATALGLWIAALVYASRRAREKVAPYYPIAVLAVSNFIGALVYYFLFVRRHSESSSRADVHRKRYSSASAS